MSGFSDVAIPGRLPSFGTRGDAISPEQLFSGRRDYNGSPDRDFEISKVKVEIFDLSDMKQRRSYERLWADLLVKVSRGEAVVEASKDLVKRPDGTSFWQKYVEYVVFCGNKKAKEVKNDKER